MHGKGELIWKDGRKYIGNYENDKKHGQGEFHWSDGRIYKGEWAHGKQHGIGVQIFPNGEQKVFYQNTHFVRKGNGVMAKGRDGLMILIIISEIEQQLQIY